MFGAGVWWCWSPLVVMVAWRAHRVEAQWADGRWPSGPVGWRPCRPTGWQGVVAWGWWPAFSFSILWNEESFHRLGVQGAKALGTCVSSVSARSLIHGAHAVCVCVPVTILDPPHSGFDLTSRATS
jgi:hypothetical protein